MRVIVLVLVIRDTMRLLIELIVGRSAALAHYDPVPVIVGASNLPEESNLH